MKLKKCPNCGDESLKFILDEWICSECEYHSKSRKKNTKASFR